MENLGVDQATLITYHLPWKEVATTLPLLNRRWRVLAQDDKLWLPLLRRYFPDMPVELAGGAAKERFKRLYTLDDFLPREVLVEIDLPTPKQQKSHGLSLINNNDRLGPRLFNAYLDEQEVLIAGACDDSVIGRIPFKEYNIRLIEIGRMVYVGLIVNKELSFYDIFNNKIWFYKGVIDADVGFVGGLPMVAYLTVDSELRICHLLTGAERVYNLTGEVDYCDLKEGEGEVYLTLTVGPDKRAFSLDPKPVSGTK